jgi:adenylate cyclase
MAAAEARALRVSDLSRVQRFAAAVRDTSHDENRTRTIALPGIPEAMSQIAVPLVVQGQVLGVLFAESHTRFTFTAEDESALVVVAGQVGAALTLAETLAEDPQEAPQPSGGPREAREAPFQVTHHVFDDSVFIDNEYLIKGVSGRLLVFFLEAYRREGRRDFTNRELRLARALRLPDLKDNLETRLLLLRRRLEERRGPVRLLPAGRGRVTLQVSGQPSIEHVHG